MLTTLTREADTGEPLSERNARLMALGARSLESASIEDYLMLHREDVLFHVFGPDRIAGDHRGRNSLRAMLAQMKELAGGPQVVTVVHDALSSAAHGVFLIQFFPDPDGSPDHDTMYVVAHFHEGLVSECWFVFWPKKVHISPLFPDGH